MMVLMVMRTERFTEQLIYMLQHNRAKTKQLCFFLPCSLPKHEEDKFLLGKIFLVTLMEYFIRLNKCLF